MAVMRSLAAAAMRTPKLPLRMSKRSVMIPSTGLASSIASRTERRDPPLRPAMAYGPSPSICARRSESSGEGITSTLLVRVLSDVASVRATGVLPSMISAICWL